MSESMFLTEDELVEMTGKVRHPAQVRVLNRLGIDHKVRPDGSIVVLRAVSQRVLGDRLPKATIKAWEPVFN
jgi:hypothetical protein